MRRRLHYLLLGLAILALPALARVLWQQAAVYEDVISREVSIWAAVSPGERVDVISREVSIAVPADLPGDDGQPRDVVSRELSLRVHTADLAIEAVAIPAQGFAGTEFNVSYRVTNVGDAVSQISWTDRLTFSGELSGDMAGNFDVVNLGALAVGASYQRTLGPFTMPDNFTGASAEFTLTVISDYLLEQPEDRDTQLGETDCDDGECNNTLTQVVQVLPAARPDLVPSIVDLASPTNGNGGYDSGSAVRLKFAVANLGTAATSSVEWSDSIYLVQDDGDGIPPADLGGASFLASRQNLTYLQAGTGSELGTFYETELDLPLPENIFGDYFLAVLCDSNGPEGVVIEGDEGNNLVFSSLVRVDLQPQPDLVVDSIVDPTPGSAFWQSGELVLVEWTLRNLGSGPAVSQITDELRLVNESDGSSTTLGSYTQDLNLLTGATVDRSVVVLLPVSLFSGVYHLEIETDRDQDLMELGAGGESNNVSVSVGIDLQLAASPDLVPEYVQLAGGAVFAQVGAPVDLEWKVRNIGAPGWDLQLTWGDTLFLVPAAELATFDATSATPLATFNESTVFGTCTVCSNDQWFIPESYLKSRTISLPQSTLPGSYGLVLVSDSGGSIFEFNVGHDAEANNQTDPLSAVLITVEAHPADLSISASAQIGVDLYQAPTSGAPGSAMLLPWSVVNVAADPLGATTSSWTDQVYLSSSASALQDSHLLVSVGNSSILAPGDPALTHLEPAQVPFVTPGSYYLFFWADRSGVVFDADGTNNLVVTPFEVTGELSDLVLASVAAPTVVAPGDPLTVSWSVDNVGPATTSGNYWIDSVYLSPDAVADPNSPSNIWIGSVARTSPLDPGEAPYSLLRQFTLSSSVAAGSYWVIVRTDTSDAVFEVDESNNWGATSLLVTLEDPPLPNLAVQDVSAQDSVLAGQELAVNYTVTNDGLGSTVTSGWTESFYLSLDYAVDSGDTYLGFMSHDAPLGAGESRAVATTLEVPLAVSGAFVLLVETNSNAAVDEGGVLIDNLNYDPQLVTVILPEAVDLLIDSVELLDPDGAPLAAALSGQHVRVRWNTVNQVSTALAGSIWVDGFFLSTDDVWSADDPLIGLVRRPLTALAGSSSSLLTSTGAEDPPLVIPAVDDFSNYRVIAVSDLFNQIPESDETDNDTASLASVSVAAMTLGLDVVQSFELPDEEQRWLRLSAPADLTIDLVLDHPNHPGAWTEIYVREGQLPSVGDYDFAGTEPQANVQSVRIPRSSGADYFVLVRALDGVGTTNLAARIETQVKGFLLEEVLPNVAGLGVVTLEFEGAELWRASGVALRPAGGTSTDDIVPLEFHLDSASGRLLALFDFGSAPAGDYDALIFDVSAALEVALPGAVVLEPALPLELGLELEVTPSFRRAESGRLDVTFRNRGNLNVPHSLATLGFRQAGPGGSGPDSVTIESAQLGLGALEITGQEQALVLLLEDLGPSQTHELSFEVTIGTNWPLEEAGWTISGVPWGELPGELPVFLQAAAESLRLAVLADPDTNGDLYQHASSAQTWLNSVESQLTLGAEALYLPGAEVLTGAGVVQAIATAAYEGSGLAPGNEVPLSAVSSEVQAGVCLPFTGTGFDCGALFPVSCGNALDTSAVAIPEGATTIGLARVCASVQDPDDPNEKTGPPGVGPRKYVNATGDLEYRVYFENQAGAGAWASSVRVEDQFDTALNSASIRLLELMIGQTLIEMPPNTGSYFEVLFIDLGAGDEVLVDISAGLDASTGTFLLSLQAIDELTGLPLTGIDAGILPPAGVGAEGSSGGYMAMTVNPAPGVGSGTGVRNRVKIQMNAAPPLETNEVENTLDADAPVSSLSQVTTPLPGLETDIHLEWSATDVTESDEGSGVATYSLYYSILDGGHRTPILLDTTDTSGVFSDGIAGGEYWFYVEATDLVGNVESTTQSLHVTIPGDCNGNGVGDDDDITNGTSLDCNGNGIPDECDVQDVAFDCNGNGIPDSCDVATGTSADINANGVPDECECVVTYYCTAAPNSNGQGALISVAPSSSVSVGLNDLVLRVFGAASNQPGLFYYGPNTLSVPFGDGVRCVGGTIFRLYPVLVADGNGDVTRVMDYSAPPMNSVTGRIDPGSTWSFQFWYRDPAAGGAGFNLSDAVQIRFCE